MCNRKPTHKISYRIWPGYGGSLLERPGPDWEFLCLYEAQEALKKFLDWEEIVITEQLGDCYLAYPSVDEYEQAILESDEGIDTPRIIISLVLGIRNQNKDPMINHGIQEEIDQMKADNNTITILPIQKLWHIYPGHSDPQPVYITLSLGGELWVDWAGESIGTVPIDVYNRRQIRWLVPCVPTVGSAQRMLEAVRPLAHSLLSEWERGVLTPRGQHIVDKIEQIVEGFFSPEDEDLGEDETD